MFDQSHITQYIQAKDNNKPHLMANVFAVDATLEMKVNSDVISFPDQVSGLSDISQVLVRDFNQAYENIYTLCLSDSLKHNGSELHCQWLVAMTDKSSQSLRFGYGLYFWHFDCKTQAIAKENRVDKLIIQIDEMSNLAASYEQSLFSWLNKQQYPWCLSTDLLKNFPEIAEISDYRSKLSQL